MVNITLEHIQKAVYAYISIAYSDQASIPRNIQDKFAALQNAATVEQALQLFKLENINGIPSYKIQLGSEKYPFLKLCLEKNSLSEEYGFYVDRHSEYMAIDSTSPSFQNELQVKEMTRELKMSIEKAFETEGVPSLRAFAKKYVETAASEERGKSKGKIFLLVEDDEDINAMHKLELSLMGYEVDTVLNGLDAIKAVENKYYDLMLLDLMMSGISGQEVIKRVASEINIVVLSALSDDFTRQTCFQLGAKGYLSKPINRYDFEKYLAAFFTENR